MTVTINGTSGITTPGVNSTASNTLGDAVGDTINVGNGTIVTDASGNVGIGTSSPDNNANRKTLTIDGTTAGTIDFKSSGTLTLQIEGTTNGSTFDTVGAYPHRFYTAGSERMRIDSSGNLLVGTTSLSGVERLSVSGSASGATAAFNRTSNIDGTLRDMIQFNRGATNVGNITCSNSATAYVTSSDYRLKENIQPMQNALAMVAQLNPVTYTWKIDGRDGQGFIAHELQAVVPDCVTGEKDAVDAEGNPVYQGIDTSFLVATLTAAIKELKAEVDELKAKVTA
jgi:hypothetical protein